MRIPVYRIVSHHLNPPDVRPKTYKLPRYRIGLVREGSVAAPPSISNSQSLFVWFKNEIVGDLDREAFFAVYLDTKNKPVGIAMISLGSLNASLVHPREVFKVAILLNASSVIFAHNHPSGNPGPSHEDDSITTRLHKAGEILGIRVLDHIVVGEEAHFSYSDAGRLGVA